MPEPLNTGALDGLKERELGFFTYRVRAQGGAVHTVNGQGRQKA